MDYVVLNNAEYPIREVNFGSDYGILKVSTEDLNSQILDEKGKYKSEEAKLSTRKYFIS